MTVLEEVRPIARSETIVGWYEDLFPQVAKYTQRRGGDLEAAKEVFQESLVLYYEKLISTDFQPEMNNQAYLMGIVKRRWLKYRENDERFQGLEGQEVVESPDERPKKSMLLNHLRQAGEKCLNLLQSFYYEGLTMKEMAHRFGYTSERSATVQKYKCLEKVREEIKSKSLNYEDFLD